MFIENILAVICQMYLNTSPHLHLVLASMCNKKKLFFLNLISTWFSYFTADAFTVMFLCWIVFYTITI